MLDTLTPGALFRRALTLEQPLQIVGTINAYTALMAQRIGFQAIYLAGAGVANASHGMPDLGLMTLNDVLEDARRITHCVDLPLLVDVDTGFGNVLNIARTVQDMIRIGVAAVHLEDQETAQRCGHRQSKRLIDAAAMCDRLKAAADARFEPSFCLMAKTDALTVEGLDATIDRIGSYIAAGADMIFLEGAQELAQYERVTQIFTVPVLANITEFGKTPLFTRAELATVDVAMVLYPLSAFRAMNTAALKVFDIIRQEGTQQNLLADMQTRAALDDFLNFHDYEERLDALLGAESVAAGVVVDEV